MSYLVNWVAFFAIGIVMIYIILKEKRDGEDLFPFYILFFRNIKVNKTAKKYAAWLGLFAFISGLLIPAISQAYFERDRFIKVESKSIYEFEFTDHLDKVKNVLDLDDHEVKFVLLNSMWINTEEEGNIKSFNYELVWKQNGSLRHARVRYDTTK